MHSISIFMIILSILSFFIAAIFFYIYTSFKNNSKTTDRVTASLISVKHKKDVPIFCKNTPYGPVHIKTVKNRSTGLYEYVVNKKQYKIRYTEYVTSRQMPRMISIIYLKKFPKITHIKNDISSTLDIYSIIFLFVGICSFFSAFLL